MSIERIKLFILLNITNPTSVLITTRQEANHNCGDYN